MSLEASDLLRRSERWGGHRREQVGVLGASCWYLDLFTPVTRPSRRVAARLERSVNSAGPAVKASLAWCGEIAAREHDERDGDGRCQDRRQNDEVQRRGVAGQHRLWLQIVKERVRLQRF